MKAHKIRSLIFFCSFVMAAIVYHQYEQQDNFQDRFVPSEMVDLEAEDAQDLEEDEMLEGNYPE